jgi:hypothetical protein
MKRSLSFLLLTACAANQPIVEPVAPKAEPVPSAAPDPEAFRKDRPKPGAPGTFMYPACVCSTCGAPVAW